LCANAVRKSAWYGPTPPYGVSDADKNSLLNRVAKGYRIQTPIADDHLTEPRSALYAATP